MDSRILSIGSKVQSLSQGTKSSSSSRWQSWTCGSFHEHTGNKTHIRTCVCMYVCMHACMHACVAYNIHIHMYIYMYIYIYAYVCMYACTPTCMCTYIFLPIRMQNHAEEMDLFLLVLKPSDERLGALRGRGVNGFRVSASASGSGRCGASNRRAWSSQVRGSACSGVCSAA